MFEAYFRGQKPITAEEIDRFRDASLSTNPVSATASFIADVVDYTLLDDDRSAADGSGVLKRQLSDMHLPTDILKLAVDDPKEFRIQYQELVKTINATSDFSRAISQEQYAPNAGNPDIEHREDFMGGMIGMLIRDTALAAAMMLFGVPPKIAIEASMAAGHGMQEARIEYGAHKNMDTAVKTGTISAISMGAGIMLGVQIIPPVLKKLGGKYMATFFGKGLVGGTGFAAWDATEKAGSNALKRLNNIEVLPEDEYNAYDAATTFGMGMSLSFVGGSAFKAWHGVKGKAGNIVKTHAKERVVDRTFHDIYKSENILFVEDAMGELDAKQMQKALGSIKTFVNEGMIQRDAVINEFNNLPENFKTQSNLKRILDIIGD